jgi:hypothetical protein
MGTMFDLEHSVTSPANGPLPTVATALRIMYVTTWGCETMITHEPSTSVMVAPARCAMDRMTSAHAAPDGGTGKSAMDEDDGLGSSSGGSSLRHMRVPYRRCIYTSRSMG